MGVLMKGIARTLSSIVVESMPVQLLSHLLTQHQYTADCQSIYFEGRKKVKDSEEIVTHSCPTLFNPMDCSPPDSLSMEFSRQNYWCPMTDEWIKKLWYIYTMEYYSVIKRNTFESVLMRWMNLEPIIQSEVR